MIKVKQVYMSEEEEREGEQEERIHKKCWKLYHDKDDRLQKEELYKILDNLATYGLGEPEFQTSLT